MKKYAVFGDRKGKKLLCYVHATDVIDASKWLDKLHIAYEFYKEVPDEQAKEA
jgi:hypothetical protein